MRDPYDRYLVQDDQHERDLKLEALEAALFDRAPYRTRRDAHLRMFDNMRSQMTVDRAVAAFVELAAA